MATKDFKVPVHDPMDRVHKWGPAPRAAPHPDPKTRRTTENQH